MKYSVVIPTYNHCNDFLKPCIDSIVEYTDLDDIELIISANGCTDNTKEYLESLKSIIPNLKVVWSDKPLGYPKATNSGIKESTCNKIILLNNDCVLLSQNKNDWLNLLNNPFNEFPNCGISCVVKDFSKVTLKDYAIFFCVMIDKKMFNEIGLLNEEYKTGSGEDIEFSYLIQEKGYEIREVYDKILSDKYFTGNFPIYHKGEGTVHDNNLVKNWSSTFLKNKLKLAKKLNREWKKMKKVNDKKIGVITPCYNGIQYIFNAIDSVKKQSIDNIVHYIYDDASTDNLLNAMKEFENDPTVCYIRNNVNKGQSYGRNFLIEIAIEDGCEVVAFLDADDIWTSSNHLENSLLFLNQFDIVYSKPEFVSIHGETKFPVNIPAPDVFIGKQLYHNNFIWTSTIVAKKECFLENKFDNDLNGLEDWDLWIRLFEKNYKFFDKQIKTVQYTVHNNSQASTGNLKTDLFNQKHKRLPNLKLHLACGHDYNEDYINVDLYAPEDAKCDVRFDVQKLPYPDNSVDEIKAFHIIEHFHFFEIEQVLKEWYRVLKPGGRLYLETPDFLETCRSFVEGNSTMPIEQWRIMLYGHFFAHPWVPGQTHKFLFTETQLRTNLGWTGFKQVNRLPPASKYVMPHTVNLFLTVEAFK